MEILSIRSRNILPTDFIQAVNVGADEILYVGFNFRPLELPSERFLRVTLGTMTAGYSMFNDSQTELDIQICVQDPDRTDWKRPETFLKDEIVRPIGRRGILILRDAVALRPVEIRRGL